MSGHVEERLAELERTLDRGSAIPALSALTRSTRRSQDDTVKEPLAIGMDSNVVLRLADKSRADVVDYLGTRHTGPLILPGQVVQEFWNNTLPVIETRGKTLRARHQALVDEAKRLGLDFSPFGERFERLLDEFTAEHAFAFDPATAGRINTVLEALERKALVPFVPRARFLAIAEVRDKTRTPPGFSDPRKHGDFFVWADFLYGLLQARDAGVKFAQSVLVTADEKLDWSLGGRAHPILVAEAEALASVPFKIWDPERLAQYVASKLSTDAAEPTAAAPAQQAPGNA